MLCKVNHTIVSIIFKIALTILMGGLFIVLPFKSSDAKTDDPEKPNIIFILVDDMVWNGLSSFGNRHVQTPNIVRLADQGMKFTNAYVSPECTPTRGELLSGQFTARTGITQVHIRRTYPNAPMTEPEVTGKLPKDNYTIANMLKDAGYATMVSGKWHLGGGRVADIKENRGMEFFEQYGFDFAGDAVEREWSRDIDDYSEKDKEKANREIIDDFFHFAGENEDQPLFAYLSFFSPHTPILAPDSLV
jgi:arylsulfatase A-like enzyme